MSRERSGKFQHYVESEQPERGHEVHQVYHFCHFVHVRGKLKVENIPCPLPVMFQARLSSHFLENGSIERKVRLSDAIIKCHKALIDN